ncbi:peptidoglycan-binding protein [Streptomyces eurocidicus]|uniref:peptidoglycan-binding protein n=1 Tax=Streptomyces eurocidicus TaxID=66423 RepID=UPI001E6406CC|nr:peptidoglycan-binding protein [Streptomyces eurocidicus]
MDWVSDDREPWCHVFVSWAFRQAGAAALAPVTASCLEGVSWFEDQSRFSEYPAVGAVVYFGSEGGTHVGIVTGYDADTIQTISGNTNTTGSPEGDGVYEKTYQRHSSYVYGYGYPDYPEGIVVADPAWKGFDGVTFFGQEAGEEDLPRGGSKPDQPTAGTVVIDGLAYGPGARGDHIMRLGKMLVTAGCSAYTEGPGPVWTSADTKSMRKYQIKIGDRGADADGIPGSQQLARLKREFGKAA